MTAPYDNNREEHPMTTGTAPEPLTAEQIRKRLDQIAPNPEHDTPDHARVLAKAVAVDAERLWHAHITRHPVWDMTWDAATKRARATEIQLAGQVFAVAHLLLALHRVSPAAADEASRQITDAWEFGEGVGEWLWLHCKDLGIDQGEVDRLEDAMQALPATEPQP